MFPCLKSLVRTIYMRLCTFTTSSELVGIHVSFVVILLSELQGKMCQMCVLLGNISFRCCLGFGQLAPGLRLLLIERRRKVCRQWMEPCVVLFISFQSVPSLSLRSGTMKLRVLRGGCSTGRANRQQCSEQSAVKTAESITCHVIRIIYTGHNG